MLYDNIREGKFISRPNRFIAIVESGGKTETVHVKNTGRCKELLLPGARVILQRAAATGRKTQYDLISVWKGERLINMDSQAPNKVFLEHLQSGGYIEGLTLIKPETPYKGSRFDIYAEAGQRRLFIEVKGVTLEENGVAMFPDAPTLRGVKHLRELADCIKEGFEARMVFVIQMSGTEYFTPNNSTHPAFGEALAAAYAAGVRVDALDCCVTKNSLYIKGFVPVRI